jgi:hypothetical protein
LVRGDRLGRDADDGTLGNMCWRLLIEDKVLSNPFTPRDLRRTVETILASLGVSKEWREHLQSHGLGGVVARHYTRHEFLAEKRAVLKLWESLLAGQPSS